MNETENLIINENIRIKALSKARSNTYYHKNKATILQKQAIKRANNKANISAIQNKNKIQLATPEPVIELAVVTPVANKYAKKRDLSEEEVLQFIQNDPDMAKRTQQTYTSDFKRLFKATDCKSLRPCLNNLKHMNKSIDENPNYGSSAKRGIFQSLLKIWDNIGLIMFNEAKASKIKKELVDQFEKYVFLTKKLTTEKNKTISVPIWTEYISRTKTNFGTDSVEYLLAVLYSNFTIRDDFSEMRIVSTMNEAKNKDYNFFVLNKNMTFVINRFKTDNKYSKLVYKVEIPELKTLLAKHIIKKSFGDYLFGKSKLSSIVSKINKINGYTYNDKSVGGVNFLRHITASQLSDFDYDDLNYEERKKLAENMLHSVATNAMYRRNLKITPVK